VRVRDEVERIRPCCLLGYTETRNGTSEFDISNLHRHQLFSNDHAGSLDPEIRQWLPRVVCPAFPFSTCCQGGKQSGDAMIRHIKACEGFKAYFPGEYRKLFSQSNNPRLSFHEGDESLRMTLGQLEFLKSQIGEAGQHKVANVSAEMVETVLRFWRPIVKPGVEEVLPSDFPLVRVPSFFGPINHGLIGLEYNMPTDCDKGLDAVSLGSSVVNENMEDVPELGYPELYLPPQLLYPTSDPGYVAAAMAAHQPSIEETSPLVAVPFSSVLEEIPRNCFEAGPMHAYDRILSSFRREETNQPEGFYIRFQEAVAQGEERFDRVFT